MKTQFETIPYGDPSGALNYNNFLLSGIKPTPVILGDVETTGINFLPTSNTTHPFIKPSVIKVSGTVINNNYVVPDVHIVSVDKNGVSKGVVTDSAGNFTVSVGSEDNVTISHVAYENQTFKGSALPKYINLIEKDTLLDEVVIKAKKKKNKVLIAGGIGFGILGLAFMLNNKDAEGMNAPKSKRKPVRKTPKKVTL